MAEVFARVREELKDRLREIEAELATVEALVAEKARIERALGTDPFATQRPAPVRRSARPRSARPRAPRGANRAALYAAVESMPGASVGELAAASRIKRPQAHALLRRGLEQGELRTVELAGGRTGYRLDAQPETAFPAVVAPPTAAVPAVPEPAPDAARPEDLDAVPADETAEASSETQQVD